MNYREQAQQFQQLFRQRQQAGLLSRLLLWLGLGLMLLIAVAVLMFFLLLSWLLIPVFLYKRHQLKKRMQQAFSQQQWQSSTETGSAGRVIEGEVIDRKD
ncbi:hypothetical protein [Rheinheimera sp.]|uniref:hypothetical protein n=1 Tax=Rheinheimera sp. TaxID=1869214 RepID=UPI00307FB8D0